MKAIEFKGADKVYGANQEEYNNLPAQHVNTPEGHLAVLYCYQPSEEELEILTKEKKIYGLQVIGGGQFNPVNCYVINPTLDEDQEKLRILGPTYHNEMFGELAPSQEVIDKTMKAGEVEVEMEGVVHKNLQMTIDETYTFEWTKEQLQLFLDHANRFIEKNDWFTIQDTAGKAFYYSLRQMVKNNEILFKDTMIYSIECNYLDVWVMYRFARIAQIEINEENDEQRFFQGIAAQLFDLI